MNRKNIIVLVAPGVEPETWGNFKKMCEAKKFPYHSLKILKFPIEFKEYIIYKTSFK